MTDRVYVLGAGAIGLALAAHLKLEHRDVLLVRTSRDDVAEEAITISMKTAEDKLAKVTATMVSLEKKDSLDGIVVIASKAYANEPIAKKLSRKKLSSPLVVMQNGLGVEQPFLKAGFSEIYRCILFSTSQRLDEFVIQFRPVTASPIGIVRGDSQNLQKIVDTLNTPGFQFSAEAQIQEKIWQKAILNSVFNSICPLLEVDNGIFHRDGDVAQIALEVMKECISVASAIGINLDIDELQQQMLTISRAADGQLISTLQDIRNRRETEMNSLNMEIARIAEEQDPIVQVDKTRLLGEMILLKSKISRSRSNSE
ncbi:MAG: ketopantoate reductase family protein [Candidatus Thorarchaeota archaeon]